MTWWLLRKGRGSRSRLIYLSVFAFTLVFLFSVSSVYHILEPDTAGRGVLRRLDHAAIFTLIAGTFTPIHLGAACLGVLSLAGDPMLISGVVGRHEIFHFFVLAGAGFHWAFVSSFADFES